MTARPAGARDPGPTQPGSLTSPRVARSVRAMTDDERSQRAVARELLLGPRAILAIAGRLGCPVEAVNAARERVRTGCGEYIELRRP